METIKHFLISLAKEGLQEGHVIHNHKKYIFKKVKGVTQVDILELAPPGRREQTTEKREPVVQDQRPEMIRPETGEVPSGSRPYKYVIFILIFIAAVMLVIFGLPWLNKKSSLQTREESSWRSAIQLETVEAYRQYIREYPQGKYSLEAVSRLEKLEHDTDTENQFQQLLARAEKHLADGELEKAVQTVEDAKKIRNNEDTDALGKKIEKRIASQTEDEKYDFYIEMARQAFSQNDMDMASQNLVLARSIRQGPEIEELDRKIKDQADKIEKQEKQSRLIRLAENALAVNEFKQATGYLVQAKEIENNAETDALEKRIQDKEVEEKKREEEKKIDDVYNRYLGFARDYFRDGKYDRALENIQQARKIKETEDLKYFENQVRQKQSEQSTRSVKKQNIEQYNRYMKNARSEFDMGRYDSALDLVRKAREINDTEQADSLEKDIHRVQDGVEKEKQRIEEEKRRQQEQAKVRSVKIIDLPAQLINNYNETLKMFEIVKLARGIRVVGQINLSLMVRENGKLAIQKLSDAGLEVFPPQSRRNIIKRIFQKIGSIKLSSPIDQQGLPVRVENWRLTYSVGTFANKVIFRRKF